ncbi:MAG: hypothetical protein WC769_05025 [Thermodesulfovibrionales bacterium]|jgi:hypothetical protein
MSNEDPEAFPKIQILLQEYSTLRSEILSRTNNMYQLIVGAPTVLIFILQNKSHFWILFAILVAVSCLFSWLISRDISKAARRLRRLENDINFRAKDHLLEWETRWGGNVTGYWGRAEPLPYSDEFAAQKTGIGEAEIANDNISQKSSNSNTKSAENSIKIGVMPWWRVILLVLLVVVGLFLVTRFQQLQQLYSSNSSGTHASQINIAGENTMDMAQINKIQILLHEYDTLREEILTRSSHGILLFGVAIVLFVWLIIRDKVERRLLIACIIIICLLGGVGWTINRDISKAASRLRELEKDINHRVGEELLIWETKWGGAVTGYIGLAKPLTDAQPAPIDAKKTGEVSTGIGDNHREK